MSIVKISSKNQITIPKSILEALRLRSGKRVVIERRKEGVLLRPLKRGLAEEYYGYAKETWRKLGGGEKYLRRERASWDH